MVKRTHPTRRGLTLVELMLSLTVTIVLGAAMTGVIGAVIAGVDVRRDSRSHAVRAYAAQSRLLAYIVPSRAILRADDTMIVLWFDDSRPSETVHASEVRWLTFSRDDQTITVHFVRFPETWTSVEKWLADREYAHDADWASVRQTYRSQGHLESLVLVDGVSELEVSRDRTSAVDSQHLMLRMTFASKEEAMTTQVSATLRQHLPPLR